MRFKRHLPKSKPKLAIFIAALILILGGIVGTLYNIKSRHTQNVEPTSLSGIVQPVSEPPQTESTPQPQQKASSTPALNKKQYSLDNPTSLWVVINKKRPLPSDFTPPNLIGIGSASMQSQAVSAAQKLISTANQNQVSLKVISGYRSYQKQQELYASYVAKDGQAAADTYSARPGYSEHQTGLAADLGNSSGQCDLDICFATTAGGRWLAGHAHEFGFVIRYERDKTPITGYQYEPWHIRYVGVDLARELYSKKQTLEEYFGLPAAPGY